jgi:hypothetical protein
MNPLFLAGVLIVLSNVFGISEMLMWWFLDRLCALIEIVLTGGVISAVCNYQNYRYLIVSGGLGILMTGKQLLVFSRELGYLLVDCVRGNGSSVDKLKMGWRMGREYVQHQTRKYLFPPVTRRGRNFIVNYSIGMSEYSLLLPRVRRNNRVGDVADADGKSVMADIARFLGPADDFHGRKVTPRDLGYPWLHFVFIDGSERAWEEDEVIEL